MAKKAAPAPYLAWIIPYQGETTPPIPPTEPPGGGTPPPDGSGGAPAGAAQHPNLLDNYVLRPPFKVPGVDYHVGVPSNITLKNPATMSLAGVDPPNTSTHAIFVSGSNVTFDGWDFSLDGGWSVNIRSGCDKIVIQNCKFGITSTKHSWGRQVDQYPGAGSLTIRTSTFDGGGVLDHANVDCCIKVAGTGDVIIEYNWLVNLCSDTIAAGNNGLFHFRYNLCENVGMGSIYGTHGDVNQVAGAKTEMLQNFNLIYESSNISGGNAYGSQGLGMDGGTATTLETAYNVAITTQPLGSMNRFTAIAPPTIVGTATTHDNYIDPSNFGTFSYPGSSAPNSTFANNFDMLTGEKYSDNL